MHLSALYERIEKKTKMKKAKYSINSCKNCLDLIIPNYSTEKSLKEIKEKRTKRNVKISIELNKM